MKSVLSPSRRKRSSKTCRMVTEVVETSTIKRCKKAFINERKKIRIKTKKQTKAKTMATTTSIDNTKWICSTCHSNLCKGKLPECSKANKMGFPVKPQCLNLTPLEERLISLGIQFMQRWTIIYSWQCC